MFIKDPALDKWSRKLTTIVQLGAVPALPSSLEDAPEWTVSDNVEFSATLSQRLFASPEDWSSFISSCRKSVPAQVFGLHADLNSSCVGFYGWTRFDKSNHRVFFRAPTAHKTLILSASGLRLNFIVQEVCRDTQSKQARDANSTVVWLGKRSFADATLLIKQVDSHLGLALSQQSFGLRVPVDALAAVRKLVSPDDSRFQASNSQVRGRFQFEVVGLPPECSRSDVITNFAAWKHGDKTGWAVIPLQHWFVNGQSHWLVSSDIEPQCHFLHLKNARVLIQKHVPAAPGSTRPASKPPRRPDSGPNAPRAASQPRPAVPRVPQTPSSSVPSNADLLQRVIALETQASQAQLRHDNLEKKIDSNFAAVLARLAAFAFDFCTALDYIRSHPSEFEHFLAEPLKVPPHSENEGDLVTADKLFSIASCNITSLKKNACLLVGFPDIIALQETRHSSASPGALISKLKPLGYSAVFGPPMAMRAPKRKGNARTVFNTVSGGVALAFKTHVPVQIVPVGDCEVRTLILVMTRFFVGAGLMRLDAIFLNKTAATAWQGYRILDAAFVPADDDDDLFAKCFLAFDKHWRAHLHANNTTGMFLVLSSVAVGGQQTTVTERSLRKLCRQLEELHRSRPVDIVLGLTLDRDSLLMCRDEAQKKADKISSTRDYEALPNSFLDGLCVLFEHIEETGSWPLSLTKGYLLEELLTWQVEHSLLSGIDLAGVMLDFAKAFDLAPAVEPRAYADDISGSAGASSAIGDAVMTQLRADCVCQEANGSMIKAASATMLAGCFETTLTLHDPVAERTFVKQVTGINLGLQNVTPAKLTPSVREHKEETQQVWVHASYDRNPEAWSEIAAETAAACKRHVVERIAKLAACEVQKVDCWNFKVVKPDMRALSAIVRVPIDKAVALMNSKDSVLFFRPFVTKLAPVQEEKDVAIVWSRFKTVPEMSAVTNTLRGIQGFVANKQSLGVRVSVAYVGAARKALQGPNPRICDTNCKVAGLLHYQTQGWEQGTSAQKVIATLAAPADGGHWSVWNVIPFKCSTNESSCTWAVKADVPPPSDRLILADQRKVLITQIPTAAQRFETQMKHQSENKEIAKATRRAAILQGGTSNPVVLAPEASVPADPWQSYLDQKATKNLRQNPQSARAHNNTTHVTEEVIEKSAIVKEMRRNIAEITDRVNAQESKIGALERTIVSNHAETTQNHAEVMDALRALTLSGKREPELPPSPLKQQAMRDQLEHLSRQLVHVIQEELTFVSALLIFLTCAVTPKVTSLMWLNHEELRSLIVNRIIASPTLHNRFYDSVDFNNYIANMSKEGFYGDELCIQSFVECLDVGVCVYHPRGRPVSFGASASTIHLAHNGVDHFDVYVPKVNPDVAHASLPSDGAQTASSSVQHQPLGALPTGADSPVPDAAKKQDTITLLSINTNSWKLHKDNLLPTADILMLQGASAQSVFDIKKLYGKLVDVTKLYALPISDSAPFPDLAFATACVDSLQAQALELQNAQAKARIAAWRSLMRESAKAGGKASFKWLRDDWQPPVQAMVDASQNVATDPQQMASFTRNAWDRLFNQSQQPSWAEFHNAFADFIPHTECVLPKLRAKDLAVQIRKMNNHRAVACDGWRVRELKVLPDCILDVAATLYEDLEAGQCWAASNAHSIISCIPKVKSDYESDSDHIAPVFLSPFDCRPISNISVWSTLYSGLRYAQTETWRESLLPASMHARRGHESCDTACELALLNEFAHAKNLHLGGVSLDRRKFFDLLPHDLIFSLLEAMGLPGYVVAVERRFYAQLTCEYKALLSIWTRILESFSDTGPAWTQVGGPSGIPRKARDAERKVKGREWLDKSKQSVSDYVPPPSKRKVVRSHKDDVKLIEWSDDEQRLINEAAAGDWRQRARIQKRILHNRTAQSLGNHLIGPFQEHDDLVCMVCGKTTKISNLQRFLKEDCGGDADKNDQATGRGTRASVRILQRKQLVLAYNEGAHKAGNHLLHVPTSLDDVPRCVREECLMTAPNGWRRFGNFTKTSCLGNP
ncbi:unnamed protein product [Symbiodinium sp. KB8]|nr:unnamed protein product [Symbiodinium sp. KB8]